MADDEATTEGGSHRSEAAVRPRTLEALAEAREQLDTMDRLAALGQLSAGLTHELRNLMTGVLGFAQVARTRLAERPEAVPALLKQIEQEVSRCIDVLNHFLGFARSDSGSLCDVAIADVVEAVVRLVRHQLAMAHVKLEVRVARGLPTIAGNARALEQVLVNLVRNAMQAMPDGGTVGIVARATEAGVVVEVSDTGSGIPAAVREQIFEPFFTTKGIGQGSGLGLFISRAIVDNHKGRLELVPAASAPRTAGAVFRITLPRGSAPRDPSPEADATKEAETP